MKKLYVNRIENGLCSLSADFLSKLLLLNSTMLDEALSWGHNTRKFLISNVAFAELTVSEFYFLLLISLLTGRQDLEDWSVCCLLPTDRLG